MMPASFWFARLTVLPSDPLLTAVVAASTIAWLSAGSFHSVRLVNSVSALSSTDSTMPMAMDRYVMRRR
jgi:hypothetical protein